MGKPLETHDADFLQDLFYRSKFGQLLTELNEIERKGGLNTEQLLLKANLFFEWHHVDQSKEILRQVRSGRDSFDENYLYAAARLAYLDNQYQDALVLVEEIFRHTQSHHHRFKALLGMANTHNTLGNSKKIPALIEQLAVFEPLKRDDEKISLTIFLGNYYVSTGAGNELAFNYFKKSLTTAASKTWTYFITRSLYGMACVHIKKEENSELMWTLEILQSFVDESEQIYFSHIINRTFKDYFAIETPVEFDTANNRILIKDKWIPFGDRPKLFQFLRLLHDRASFVAKEAIASNLWPGETYNARIHDPRIFDIAKRARHLIEAYEQQPVILLSGRMGYKLNSV